MRLDDDALRRGLIPDPVLPDPVPGGLTPAAVLVTVHADQGEDWLLFTRRTEHLRKHKGQISFPGGKFDPGEDQRIADAALRESWEEIGLLPNHVTLFGSLPPFDTISSYLLYPFVGRFDWPYDLRVNADEISEIIRVPLSHLRLPETYRSDEREYRGGRHVIHYYDYAPHTIWGITGYILYEFLKLLSENASAPGPEGVSNSSSDIPSPFRSEAVSRIDAEIHTEIMSEINSPYRTEG